MVVVFLVFSLLLLLLQKLPRLLVLLLLDSLLLLPLAVRCLEGPERKLVVAGISGMKLFSMVCVCVQT